jgi:hypothetical protein
MPRPYVTLAEHPTDIVRLACTKCERRGQYRMATLLERYGPDANMVALRLILAAGCPKIAAGKGIAQGQARSRIARTTKMRMHAPMNPAIR